MKSIKKNINYKVNFVLKPCFLIVGFIFFLIQILHAQHVKLGWDSSANLNIFSYNIYRANHIDSSFSLLKTVTHPDSTYMDANMEWDTHYYYVATSVDKFGNESSFSNMIDTTLQSPVPVELYSFSARISHSKNIILEWSTKAESNNYGFELQRRSNESRGQFERIGFVKGNGTAEKSKNYHFVDKSLPGGMYYYRLKQIDFDGSYQFSNTIEVTIILPYNFHLHQNYPNPFNNSTVITYNLPMNSHVELTIYDVIGHKVYRLIDLFQTKGKYSVKWDAKDFLGREVGSGVYYYKIKTASFTEFRKMMLLK